MLCGPTSCAVVSAQTIELRPATEAVPPSPTDSNSPAYWQNGNLVLFNAMGTPYRSEGADQFSLIGQVQVQFGQDHPSPSWIEAAWVDDDGTVFGWYHYEPPGLCGGNGLTAPKIGAVVSYDNGYSFQDLGIVLESGDALDCNAQNGYFAGGHGDFSVAVDASRTYIYFSYDNYGGDVSSQGVAIARLDFNSRFNPAGSVWKYYNGDFTEPGLGGQLTPTFSANVSWSSPNADSFWGPSVHWNKALNQYVMLLNRSCCSPGWPQEGIYISLNSDIGDPMGWSTPVKILDGSAGWYPQVLGECAGETDKLAGAVSRLYVYGVSDWELVITPDSPSSEPDDPQYRRQSPRIPRRR